MQNSSGLNREENMRNPERFSRNIGVLTEEEQSRLLHSTVAIVGMGCTGCAVTEFLARAGVGGFTLIDGDRFDETNLNRQLYAKISTTGQLKAIAARNAVLDINPQARVTVHTVFLQPENAYSLLGECDLIVNGLDDPFSMVVLHRTARALGKPSVFLLSGCIPFQGVFTTFPPDGDVDYETTMGLPTVGKPLEPCAQVKQQLFENITKARVFSALRRGAIPGAWVERRLQGGSIPSFGATSNITAIMAAMEAIKNLIHRADLPPVCAPDLVFFDAATCTMTIQKPSPGAYWFQGSF
jgi:molybdopterin/thiamine biosynthesis adenylyltransferase